MTSPMQDEDRRRETARRILAEHPPPLFVFDPGPVRWWMRDRYAAPLAAVLAVFIVAGVVYLAVNGFR